MVESTSIKKDGKNKNYDEELYGKKSICDLILFSIYSLTKNNKKCTFERILKECFYLFPKVFGFPQHSEWPDSRKIDRPLRILRKRKLIKGDPKTYFSLTRLGERKTIEITRGFGQKKIKFK